MADSRPKGPQFKLGHFRVAELQPLSPMYSTRPCCLVQTITRRTCADQNLDSWNCLAHLTYIALNGSMSSTDQQGSSLGTFLTFPSPLYSASGFWPCVKSCLVGGYDKYHTLVACGFRRFEWCLNIKKPYHTQSEQKSL